VFKALDPNDPELAGELRKGAVRRPVSAIEQASKDVETLAAPVSLGDGTYRIKRSANSVFVRDAKPYVCQVTEDAEEFCAGLGKAMKVVSISESKGSIVSGRFAEATLVFKALDPNDPELAGELRKGP